MKASILLVDRDPALVEEVQRLMSLRGRQVRSCLSGQECVGLLEELTPRVVVLDVEVVGESLTGVLDWFRRRESLIPPMLVVATDPAGSPLPDSLRPWVELQIQRPRAAGDFLSFATQLETLAWWSQSPHREAQRGRGSNTAVK